jgi:uncharacterized protein YjbJ (UPF0337 family)
MKLVESEEETKPTINIFLIKKGEKMQKDHVAEGKWKQLEGSVKERWGKLTDDEVTQVEGSAEKLAGKLQEKYGYTIEEAKKEVTDFFGKKK